MKTEKKPLGSLAAAAQGAKDKNYTCHNSQLRLNLQEIKKRASHRWVEILSVLAPALGPALEKPGKHVPCPVHGGKDGFRVFKDVDATGGGVCNTCGSFGDGFALLQWVNSWSFRQSLEAVSISLGLIPGCVVSLQDGTLKASGKKFNGLQGAERRRKNLLAVWEESQELRTDDPAHKYLCRRIPGLRIEEIPSLKIVLRYHARLPYYKDLKFLDHFPALIAAIQDVQGRVVSLHRTYLSKGGGKAHVNSSKKIMPPVVPGGTQGAAIKLFSACEILGLTEGIETALGVHVAKSLPVWACVSANGLEMVEIPATVREVVIFADNDVSLRGQQAAHALAKRLLQEGRKVDIKIPEKPGTDWLNVYVRGLQNG
jgi:phage/plasmid primase-like uncharacterized protein